MKPEVRVDGTAVTVRGPRPAVERIADRLLAGDYPYRVEGGLYGERGAEIRVRFEAEAAAAWCAGIAGDELFGSELGPPDVE